MKYENSINQLAKEYMEHPIEYGTEADLTVRLCQLLIDELEATGRPQAEVNDPRLVGETRTYKQPYKDVVEERFRARGTLGRVRLNASVDKRQQHDVIVFNETVANPVEWLRSGSKRFDEDDLDAAFGVKYIKNKCYPPTRCPITDDSILEMDLTELQSAVDATENNLRGDLEELRSLPGAVETVFVLVSNNNYLFAEPLADGERAEHKKRRIGEAFRAWIRDTARHVDVLYVHPRGSTWISGGTEAPSTVGTTDG